MDKVSSLLEGKAELRWAPVVLQPIIGSEERLIVAIAAVDDSGETRCLRTLDPDRTKAVFRERSRYVNDVVAMVVRSMVTHLAHEPTLTKWIPPLEGVHLGVERLGAAKDIDTFVRRAGAMVSVFHGELIRQPSVERRQPWARQVTDIVRARNSRLGGNLGVRIPLGDHDAPAPFTFLNATFAANLVTFSRPNLARRIEEARAGMWSLSLLSDSPFLFNPERKELLAGTDFGDEPGDAKVREAVDEIADEASRRDVLVTEFRSPEAVAEHILQHAA